MAATAHSSTSGNTVRDLVARHPLAAYAVLAYALASAWLLDDRIDLGTVNGFGIIGSTAPALAALLVAALLNPEPSGVAPARRWRSFGLVGVLALAVMAVVRLWHAAGLVTVAGSAATTAAYPNLTALLVDVLAAGVVATIVSGVYSSRQGVASLLHSLDPRGHALRRYWWALALGFYPLVCALGNAVSAGVGLPVPAPTASGPWYWLALDALLMFVYYLFAGGGLEEPGWRGFALPLLQQRYSPLRASLILAVIWAFWHWPVFWLAVPAAGAQVVVSFLLFLLLQVVPLALLFTAVFNRSAGSLPIAILLHTSINTTERYLPVSVLATGLLLLLSIGLAVWMARAPQTFACREVENHVRVLSVDGPHCA